MKNRIALVLVVYQYFVRHFLAGWLWCYVQFSWLSVLKLLKSNCAVQKLGWNLQFWIVWSKKWNMLSRTYIFSNVVIHVDLSVFLHPLRYSSRWYWFIIVIRIFMMQSFTRVSHSIQLVVDDSSTVETLFNAKRRSSCRLKVKFPFSTGTSVRLRQKDSAEKTCPNSQKESIVSNIKSNEYTTVC